MNKKLLIITSWYPTSEQDRHRTWAIANIANQLKSHGVSTVVAVPRPEHKSVVRQEVYGMPVYSLPGSLCTEPFSPPPFSANASPLDVLKGIVLFTMELGLHLGAWVWSKRHRKRWRDVFAAQGPFDAVVLHGRPHRGLSLLKGLWSRPVSVCFHETDLNHSTTAHFLKDKADRIANVGFRSEILRNQFVELGYIDPKVRYHIVLSGVPSATILPRGNYRVRRNQEPLRLLCVTTMIPRKNVPLLATTLLQLRDLDWTLDFMGRGPELENYKELIKGLGLAEKITFHGFVPHHQLMDSYKNYDVFVLLSEKETFGMVYTEALSQGLFVIGSEGEGIDGVLEDGVNGFLVSPAEPARLLDVLRGIDSMKPEDTAAFQDRIFQSATSLNQEDIGKAYFERMVSPC